MQYRGSLERCKVYTSENFIKTEEYQNKNLLSFDLAAEIK
jgi:hypothetical protein